MMMTVNTPGYSAQIKAAYDSYLEEYLPRMGESRDYAGDYGSKVLAFSTDLSGQSSSLFASVCPHVLACGLCAGIQGRDATLSGGL